MTEHQAMMELMQRCLDDGLDAVAQGRLEAHLRSCAGCALEWEGLQALHRQLLAVPRLTVAGDFTARVLQRIAADQQQQERVRRAQVFPLIVAAGVLGVLSTVLLLAPLAGLASLELWATVISDALTLFTVAVAWLTILSTFFGVALAAAGDGPLVVGTIFVLVLTLVWVRLVSGTGLFSRSTFVNGGVS